jgi:hypothetical protein
VRSLMSGHGDVLGVISIHFQMPHHLSKRELGLIDLLARQVPDYFALKRNDGKTRISSVRYSIVATISSVLSRR